MRRGKRDAAKSRQALRNPVAYPEPLRYLHEWAQQLCGRSGFSEVGVNPLTWTTLTAWMDATGHRPTAAEVEALFTLDRVLRDPASVPEDVWT